MTRLFCSLLLACVFVVQPAFAQPRREARLLVTVVDPSGAVVPKAKVTIVGLDDATKAVTRDPVESTDTGLATIPSLPPGRYSVTAEFPGFELGLLRDVRLRAGDNKHLVVLPLQKISDSVTVGRDAQNAASDRASTFGTAMTREQIEALSDDPDEMQRQLQEVAGGGTIRIDSFEGGRLPPKAQIKSVHITRDAFAAENHSAHGLFIDIITQPGMGPLRGGMNYRLRDGALAARNPMAPTKGPERMQSFGASIGGTLIRERSSFSLSINGSKAFDTPLLKAATLEGSRSEIIPVRRPRDNMFAYALWDFALTKDQTLRVTYNQETFTSRNLGIGAYDLPSRAYSSEDHWRTLRIQEAGPLGRRFFINTRLELMMQDREARSDVELPTIRVLDAFTSGGQQQSGGQRNRTFNLMSDLDYVRGIHSVRTGIQLTGGSYRSDDFSNYLGTYTFESLAAYEDGRARSYTRRIGDPNIRYWNVQAGVYLQDDIRVSKQLTLSPGLRYEAQTHLDDVMNVAPRFGFTWSPWKSGKTTFRGSWGIFYDWLPAGTYEQTLRVNGFRQRELNVMNPTYPDPGDVGTILPTNRYLLADDLHMIRNTRLSAGIEQRLTPRIRVGGTYAYTRGSGLLRGSNLNAPVDGVRPDLSFVNVIEVVGDARSTQHTVSASGSIAFSTPSPALRNARFNWRRGSVNAGYTLNRLRNNTEGAFATPVTGSLDQEWGPSNGDVRHRVNFGVNSQALKNLSVFIFANGSSAPPYTLRTGRDDNGDLIFNDRPAGIGRNTERARGQFTMNGNFSYSIPVGKRTVTGPQGISITSVGGALSVSTMAAEPMPRYRISINLSVQNLTNRKNYSGFTGTLTSPFFGQPTTVLGTRRVDLGVGISF